MNTGPRAQRSTAGRLGWTSELRAAAAGGGDARALPQVFTQIASFFEGMVFSLFPKLCLLCAHTSFTLTMDPSEGCSQGNQQGEFTCGTIKQAFI